MRAHRRFVALIAVLTLALAVPALAQAPDRSTPPAPGPPPTLKLPEIQKRSLSNGLPVRIVELHKVPIVQIDLLVLSGAGSDPAGKYGVASMVAAMLDEGAGKRSALEIADEVDYLGATLSTGSSFDTSAVGLWVPVARLSEALPIMADVALRPTFPPPELERLRKERLTSMLQARDDPRSIAELAFPRIVFGEQNRYGSSASGTPDAVKSFTVDDLRSFYRAYYRPGNAALIVVGDVKADSLMPQLEAAFGGWKGEGPSPSATPVPNAQQLAARQVYIIDKPGAPQSQIRIGGVGVPRSTPDYYAVEVLNTILGGSFSSRLNQNLREKHGYTYGAGSSFVMRLSAGPFVASSGVETEVTAGALKEFFNELTGILKPVPSTELARARNYVALSFPGEFETAGDIARKLEELTVYRLPDDYFATYVSRIEAVSEADVQRVAQKYILPARFAVVIVGDRKTIEAGVRALNLGPVKVMTIQDALGRAVPVE
jgi:zinc protease